MQTIHDYNQDIKKSERNAIPDSFYQSLFGAGIEIRTIPRNHKLQTKGRIDKLIKLPCGKIITIEEKVRFKQYPDLLIEEYSSEEKKTDGWINKPTLAEYLVYYFKNTGAALIYKMPDLQNEWKERQDELKALGTERRAFNTNYTTLNWSIPLDAIHSKCFKLHL